MCEFQSVEKGGWWLHLGYWILTPSLI